MSAFVDLLVSMLVEDGWPPSLSADDSHDEHAVRHPEAISEDVMHAHGIPGSLPAIADAGNLKEPLQLMLHSRSGYCPPPLLSSSAVSSASEISTPSRCGSPCSPASDDLVAPLCDELLGMPYNEPVKAVTKAVALSLATDDTPGTTTQAQCSLDSASSPKSSCTNATQNTAMPLILQGADAMPILSPSSDASWSSRITALARASCVPPFLHDDECLFPVPSIHFRAGFHVELPGGIICSCPAPCRAVVPHWDNFDPNVYR